MSFFNSIMYALNGKNPLENNFSHFVPYRASDAMVSTLAKKSTYDLLDWHSYQLVTKIALHVTLWSLGPPNITKWH